MKIVKFEYFTEETLIENLRKVHLAGRPELKIYQNANITLKREVSPDNIIFSQYYVMKKDIEEITQTRKCLLSYGIDIFKLQGYIRLYYIDDMDHQLKVFDILPPIVEISKADENIPLLNDGMHRLYLARESKSLINIVMIGDFDYDYPYYALPNYEGWKNLKICSEVPEIKKNYRTKDYKTLFRDFNSAFINVTQPRVSKNSSSIKVAGEKIRT